MLPDDIDPNALTRSWLHVLLQLLSRRGGHSPARLPQRRCSVNCCR